MPTDLLDNSICNTKELSALNGYALSPDPSFSMSTSETVQEVTHGNTNLGWEVLCMGARDSFCLSPTEIYLRCS